MNDSEITKAAKFSQELAAKLARRNENITDRTWCRNRDIWSHQVDMDDPVDGLHSLIMRTIKRWRGLNIDRFSLTQDLAIWSVKAACMQQKNAFKAPWPQATPYCIQLETEDAYIVKMKEELGEVQVCLARKGAVVTLERFLTHLEKEYEVGRPSYDLQQRFWEQTGQRFRWFELSSELKWKVMEHIVEPATFKPSPTKATALQGPFMWPTKVNEKPFLMSSSSLQVMVNVFNFETTLVEYEMLVKAAVRANTFKFNWPSELVRFLDTCIEGMLPQIRRIHLAFKNDDFMAFWGGDVLPNGRKNTKFAGAAKRLGQLQLDEVAIEPRLFANTSPRSHDDPMTIRGYFRQPVLYGCHEKAVKYICGLATRHLHNTKKVRLDGVHFRPSWQQDVDRMLSFARKGELSDNFFMRKEFDRLVADPKMGALVAHERMEAPGGVRVPKEKKKAQPKAPNTAAAAAAAAPSSGISTYSEALDLPERDFEEDGLLWRCECYEPCNDGSFNREDAPVA